MSIGTPSPRPATPRAFAVAFDELRRAQKDSRGAPPYSRFINRPAGRVIAAAAHQLGLTPNLVTIISAGFTFTGIVVLAAGGATWGTGVLVALLLMVGYALDAADGQLARLRGGGSPDGEWLDHVIDAAKLASIHLAVLITCFRAFDLPSQALLLVPIGFSIVSCVHFFGMVVTELIVRERQARMSPTTAFTPPARVGSRHSAIVTVARLPVDYGLICLVFVVLGAHLVFFVLYSVMALASAGYLLLALGRWFRMVRRLRPAPGQGFGRRRGQRLGENIPGS